MEREGNHVGEPGNGRKEWKGRRYECEGEESGRERKIKVKEL